MPPDPCVRLLDRDDVAATAALLAKAFDDDPAYAFLFPRPAKRRRGLEDFFARNLRTHLPYRCTHVATEGAAIVGTVTLRPPEGFAISTWTLMRQGLLPFGFSHGWSAVRRLLALKDAYEDIEARVAGGDRHWYVHMMAVDPDRHGQGIGSRLIQRVLADRADAARGHPAPAVLTTHKERNVVFYERVGFERTEVQPLSMLGAAPYSVWSMRRRPRV